jgi:hypothetical protein
MHVAAGAGLLATAIFGAMSAATPAAADARYPWCATYRGGSENCGFSTYEQCMFTVGGNTGFCTMNRSYTGSDAPRAQARRPRRI